MQGGSVCKYLNKHKDCVICRVNLIDENACLDEDRKVFTYFKAQEYENKDFGRLYMPLKHVLAQFREFEILFQQNIKCLLHSSHLSVKLFNRLTHGKDVTIALCSEKQHRIIVMRFITIANLQLHKIFEQESEV